jgi:uncharacterized low-complexity protein
LASKWVYNRVDNLQVSIAHSNNCPTLVKPSEDFFFSAAQGHFFGALFLQNAQSSAGVSLCSKSLIFLNFCLLIPSGYLTSIIGEKKIKNQNCRVFKSTVKSSSHALYQNWAPNKAGLTMSHYLIYNYNMCVRLCVRRRFRVLIDWRNRPGQSDSKIGNRPEQSDSANEKSPTKKSFVPLAASCVKTKARTVGFRGQGRVGAREGQGREGRAGGEGRAGAGQGRQ